MPVTFYNPGTKITELLRFDHPTNDPQKQNNISYFRLEAPERSLFTVPTEMEIDIPETGGTVSIPVRFADRIQNDFMTYGVVRVNPRAKDVAEDANIAKDEKEAKAKGDRLWKNYLIDIARQYIIDVQEIKAAGGVPRPAKGPIAHALKVLNMADPADLVGAAVEKQQDYSRVELLERKIEELQALVAGKK